MSGRATSQLQSSSVSTSTDDDRVHIAPSFSSIGQRASGGNMEPFVVSAAATPKASLPREQPNAEADRSSCTAHQATFESIDQQRNVSKSKLTVLGLAGCKQVGGWWTSQRRMQMLHDPFNTPQRQTQEYCAGETRAYTLCSTLRPV